MKIFIRSILLTALLLQCACVSRIPLRSNEPIKSLVGRQLKLKRELWLAQLPSSGKYVARRPWGPSGDHVALKAGEVITIIDFVRLPESQGSFIIMICRINKGGNEMVFEAELHPNYRNPGSSQAEKILWEFFNEPSEAWVITR